MKKTEVAKPDSIGSLSTALIKMVADKVLFQPLTPRPWHLYVTLTIIAVAFEAYKAATFTYKKDVQTEATVVNNPIADIKELVAPTPHAKNVSERETEFSPVSVEELAGDASAAYIQRFARIAVLEMKQFGIPASISLAQGLIESRAGKSRLAVDANNHFGIKCFSKKCPTGHCIRATDDSHKDFFRKYASAWESWRAHSKTLSSGRYLKLHKYKSYKDWAYGLRKVGYATDKAYASKLIGVIEKYNLDRFDK